MSELDLTDPAIRAMVERNHQPEEQRTVGGDLLGVFCEACGHSWPCPTHLADHPRCPCSKENP